MPENKSVKLPAVIFLFIIILSGCSGNSTSQNRNGEAPKLEEDTAMHYSDSVLLDKTTQDTIEYSSLNGQMRLPEEKKFDKFYTTFTKVLNTGEPADINKYIHPKWGIYLIDRPGAIDKVDSATDIQTFYQKIYNGSERLKGMQCRLEHRPIPEVNCDKEYTGCLSEETKKYRRLTDLKNALTEYGFKDNFIPKSSRRIQQFEELINRKIVNFDKAISISFIYVDGKWYIGVIDLSQYSCSA